MAKRRKQVECEPVRLVHFIETSTTESGGQAKVVLEIGGKHITGQANGKGPIDAIFHVIQENIPHAARLTLFQIVAKGDTPDVPGEATVTLKFEGGGEFTGRGLDPNILKAATNAYLEALNELRNFEARRRSLRFEIPAPSGATLAAAE